MLRQQIEVVAAGALVLPVLVVEQLAEMVQAALLSSGIHQHLPLPHQPQDRQR
jgi:hypothetical protein